MKSQKLKDKEKSKSQPEEFLIAAIENPMLDLTVYLPNDDLLIRYGLEYGRACAATEKHLPLLAELWEMKEFTLCLGGSALNTIRCANYIMK